MKKIDLILDCDDPDFLKNLKAAIGIGPDDVVEFISPQFTRTDSRLVSYFPNSPEEYEALPLLSSDVLKKLGCQVWCEENGIRHWLYPYEWYGFIPNGTKVVCISGETETFRSGITDNDMRFGALAYGFTQTIN